MASAKSARDTDIRPRRERRVRPGLAVSACSKSEGTKRTGWGRPVLGPPVSPRGAPRSCEGAAPLAITRPWRCGGGDDVWNPAAKEPCVPTIN
eukprot:CAMPEP_0119136462 /NCGR_PEP_ID=MMETSP1310-20130426/21474_1 /TAXON_ID=464262 /ORGANISM="Genus nov. species nov., Strain RCC2339" /LENGTH=92 /DNA_ID=CAMNT_0007127449 /DNA_START=9 /DNA_END=284 /DNA_ORIENTATION=+